MEIQGITNQDKTCPKPFDKPFGVKGGNIGSSAGAEYHEGLLVLAVRNGGKDPRSKTVDDLQQQVINGHCEEQKVVFLL